ncbi:MAG: FAD-dependent thymidylate synthase [Thermoproteota archaeon]|nr:FAD-dependent thymidylate synthase [Candidatus Brockarchaeota archaeon]
MKVSLVSYTANPELVVAVAARTSFKSETPTEILEKLSKPENAERIKKDISDLLRHNHLSPIEHASFTFAIEGVSRACTHQLVRHRIASYTQQSQRFVKVDTSSGDWFVTPRTLREGELGEKFKEKMRIIASWYEEFSNKGVEKEDARFILPQATKTNIVVTMNARELLHFFNLRLCTRAQWELREVAMEMLKLVKKVAPTIFKDAGPSCMKGFCPEGDLMPEECRRIGISNIQKRFREIT